VIRIAAFLLFCAFPFISFSQDLQKEIPADTSDLIVRSVDDNTFNELTSGRDFQYNKRPENPDSLWSRIRTWFFDLLEKVFQNRWASVFIRIAFIGIFAAALIAIINQILGGNLSSTFTGKKTDEEFSLNISEEQLQQVDYDERLQTAINQRNYKDAVRILYLKALRELSIAELIQWQADKTNSDYVRELTSHPVQKPFSMLTYFYEYVEYGDFEINESGFRKCSDIYQSLKQKA
jgi:hypothetical protein